MKLLKASICRQIFLTFSVLGFLAAGCDSRPPGVPGEKPAVAVNKLQLTKSDLQEELKNRPAVPPRGTAQDPGDKEPVWLSQLIDRELLVQEAQRLGLNREPDFMRTVEHFWKQALIKQLISLKGREINASLHIYEPQIEAYYKKLAQEKGSEIEPLSVLRKDIVRTLEEETADKAMEDWLLNLRKNARISIDRETIRSLESS